MIASISRQPEREKALIKLTVEICDSFHFNIPVQATDKTESTSEQQQAASAGVDETLAKEGEEEESDSDEEVEPLSTDTVTTELPEKVC